MPIRLDAILAGRTAALTARRPDAGLVDYCNRHGLVLVRISGAPDHAAADPGSGWIDVRLAGDRPPAGLGALAADPALTVIVRPDRVIAAVEPRGRLPPPALAHPRRCHSHLPGTGSLASSPVTHRLMRRFPCSSRSRC